MRDAARAGEGSGPWVLWDRPEAAVFADRLCSEHLQEAGYLIDARRMKLDAGEDSWLAPAASEGRLLRHAEALRSWPSGAAQAVEALGSDDDDTRCGAFFATASLCAGREEIAPLWSALAPVDASGLARAVDALSLAAGGQLVPRVEEALASAPPPTQALLAAVLGARGAGGEEALLGLLTASTSSEEVRQAAARALPQLGCTRALAPLSEAARRLDPERAEPYLFALALLGDPTVIPDLRRRARSGEPLGAWKLFLLLGVQGDPRDEEALERAWLGQAGGTSEHSAVPLARAMGALGTVRPVPLLIEALRSGAPAVARAAAQGLERVTGAGILDPDDATGLRRPAVDPAAWETWWSEHGRRFKPQVRHRHGAPLPPGPEVCLGELARAGTPLPERQLAAWELQVRSPTRAPPICLEWPVERQQRALAALEQGVGRGS